MFTWVFSPLVFLAASFGGIYAIGGLRRNLHRKDYLWSLVGIAIVLLNGYNAATSLLDLLHHMRSAAPVHSSGMSP